MSCTCHPDPIRELRSASAEEWVRIGEESLRQHLLAQAVVAHCRYGPLDLDRLERMLRDTECLRHPVRLVYEFGEMGLHQFAQPDLDWRNTEEDGRVLYLRPTLRGRPDDILPAVAYMIPVINYGDVVNDEHCVEYGATLLGLTSEEYYGRICRLADEVGAEPRLAGAKDGGCAG
ncbi:MAG: hypothetical protein JNL10_01260 [Verrucomicrobiales bacterium]|nr:hypothetical protein [Verrucomicrobiales bacterium]